MLLARRMMSSAS